MKSPKCKSSHIKHKPHFSDLASVVDNPELYKCMALIKRVRNVVSLLNCAFTINQLSVYFVHNTLGTAPLVNYALVKSVSQHN